MASWAGGSLIGARRVPYWLTETDGRRPALENDLLVDLLVVGGGFTGLWAASLAAERNPGRSVVLVEAGTLGWAASGRGGGFVSSSLTHGIANGLTHWPDEMGLLERLGRENLDAIEQTVHKYDIDCGWSRTGELIAAVKPWQARELADLVTLAQRLGNRAGLVDADGARAVANSPTYVAGALFPDSTALVDPVALVRGLTRVAEGLGVRIFEGTRVETLYDEGERVAARVVTGLPAGSDPAPEGAEVLEHTVRASRVVLATSAFPSPLRRARSFTVPVWEHALVTEPLTDRQWADLGWHGGEGLSDAGNQFHYYRTTPDRRVLWGGFDAHYYYNSDLSQHRMRHVDTEKRLAEHFFTTFPQLRGLRFEHVWAGAVDISTRSTVFWLPAMNRKVVSVQGYTGMGTGASRFGAQVALDLLDDAQNERTRLTMVRRPPVPFPPEPFRWAGIQLTRSALARADAEDGRRNVWLQTLDRLGVGFDS